MLESYEKLINPISLNNIDGGVAGTDDDVRVVKITGRADSGVWA